MTAHLALFALGNSSGAGYALGIAAAAIVSLTLGIGRAECCSAGVNQTLVQGLVRWAQ